MNEHACCLVSGSCVEAKFDTGNEVGTNVDTQHELKNPKIGHPIGGAPNLSSTNVETEVAEAKNKPKKSTAVNSMTPFRRLYLNKLDDAEITGIIYSLIWLRLRTMSYA